MANKEDGRENNKNFSKILDPIYRDKIERFYEKNYPDESYEDMSVEEAHNIIVGNDYLMPKRDTKNIQLLPQHFWGY